LPRRPQPVNIGLDFPAGGADLTWAPEARAIATVDRACPVVLVLAAITYSRKIPVSVSEKDFRSSARRCVISPRSAQDPIALQKTLVNLSFLIILCAHQHHGRLSASRRWGVVQRILGITFLCCPRRFGSAVAAITAQNLGAGKKPARSSRCAGASAMPLLFAFSVFVYSQFWGSTLTSIFTSNTTVIALGAQYLKSTAIDCMMIAFILLHERLTSAGAEINYCHNHSLLATFLNRIPFSFFMIHNGGRQQCIGSGFAAPLASRFSLNRSVRLFLLAKKDLKKDLAERPVSSEKALCFCQNGRLKS
jgi:Na+-driven multidrug efflux pump